MKHESDLEWQSRSPVVRQALDYLRPVPDPDPEVWAAARRAFLAKAHEFATQAVSPEPQLRHNGWKAQSKASPLFRRRKAHMSVMVKLLVVIGLVFGGAASTVIRLLVVIGLVFGGAAGTVSAVQSSLPGSALYPLKLEVEDIQLARANAPATQARQSVALAQARVVEAQRLTERDERIPARLVERYREHLALALDATGRLSGPSQTQMQIWLAGQLVTQLQTMAQLAQRWPPGPDAVNACALQQMMQAIQLTLAQIGGEEEQNAPDDDDDGVLDIDDNCPLTSNPGQIDSDGDGIGDVCEADSDGDGVIDDEDNCPHAPNPGQEDSDRDGLGDACPFDADGDGVPDDVDNCPVEPNPDQADTDRDGLGDACDACPYDADNDADGDGVCGDVDNCPVVSNPGQEDGDSDGLGDVCDACLSDPQNDADRDGVCGDEDNCPRRRRRR